MRLDSHFDLPTSQISVPIINDNVHTEATGASAGATHASIEEAVEEITWLNNRPPPLINQGNNDIDNDSDSNDDSNDDTDPEDDDDDIEEIGKI